MSSLNNINNTPKIRSSLSKESGVGYPEDLMNYNNEQANNNNIEGNNDDANRNSEDAEEAELDAGECKKTKSRGKKDVDDNKSRKKDTVNERIGDLLELIPPSFFSDTTEKNTGTKDGRPNKGQILSKSVDYIIWLQNEIDRQNLKEVELKILLNKHNPNSTSSHSHTVAEQMLAQIGVGPLAE